MVIQKMLFQMNSKIEQIKVSGMRKMTPTICHNQGWKGSQAEKESNPLERWTNIYQPKQVIQNFGSCHSVGSQYPTCSPGGELSSPFPCIDRSRLDDINTELFTCIQAFL